MRYLVRYYNGRGQREKLFPSKDDAIQFLSQLSDNQATLWKEVPHG